MYYYYADDLIREMKNAGQLAVFGAGNVAGLVAACLLQEPYNLRIAYCMVSETGGNPKQVEGIPVVDYQAAEGLVRKDALILVAVADQYLDSAEAGLHEHGYRNLLRLTYESDLWSLLRGNCYRNDRMSKGKPYLTVEEELGRIPSHTGAGGKRISVYTAFCHVDGRLGEGIQHLPWEVPIQVGAALTQERICDIRDNTGEHISGKNKQYCELTALYWIWKNDRSDYVGLGHYRRHFEFNGEQVKRLLCSDIDVVLTIPIMDAPSVEAVYRRDHVGADWDVMLEAVREICPGYISSVAEMGRGKFYYAYNMFLMRREILEDYCAWLFPILAYCEEHCEGKADSYQNRYIGFLAEHLMSAYFLHHENEYRIVHARKHFMW